MTAAPRRANMRATVLLPVAIPPVSPTRIIRSSHFLLRPFKGREQTGKLQFPKEVPQSLPVGRRASQRLSRNGQGNVGPDGDEGPGFPDLLGVHLRRLPQPFPLPPLPPQ